jgi:4-alpha-glucanotransferase
VVFTGTHDNNTVRAGSNGSLRSQKRRLELTIGREPAVDGLHWDMIRLAMMSPARISSPRAGLLGLGAEARINTPGRWADNWLWRMSQVQFTALRNSAAGADRGLRAALRRVGAVSTALPAPLGPRPPERARRRSLSFNFHIAKP